MAWRSCPGPIEVLLGRLQRRTRARLTLMRRKPTVRAEWNVHWQKLVILGVIGLHACSDSKGMSSAPSDASVGDASVGEGSDAAAVTRVGVTVVSEDGTGQPDTA